MKIHFFGVRGSIPTPGPETSEFGGNTPCVFVELNNGGQVIFDAGTGIRALGDRLMANDRPIHLLLSHTHWDHIQGFPFFKPAYQKGREIYLYPATGSAEQTMTTLLAQLDGVNFPVTANQIGCGIICHDYHTRFFDRKDVSIESMPLNHPGGGSAFRLSENGVSVAYVTDNELRPPGTPITPFDKWVEFCAGVDVLIHDSQYLEEDMPLKHGWGHSVLKDVWELAEQARPKTLVLFHHEPERNDAQIRAIQLATDEHFKDHVRPFKVMCAREGLVLEV